MRGDPNRLKIFRGTLMTTIYMATQTNPTNPDDPEAYNGEALTMALEYLGAMPSTGELHQALRYLEGKDYVKVEWFKDGSGSFRLVRIQAKGVDLVERTIDDAGVALPNRR